MDNGNGTVETKEKYEHLKTSSHDTLVNSIQNIVSAQWAELDQLDETDPIIIRRVQMAHQFESSLEIALEKWSCMNELLGTVNQICQNEGHMVSLLRDDINQLDRQRTKFCHMWYERVINRKDDWNQSRAEMKQTLTDAARRVRLSAEQSSKMLDSFSLELVQIRTSFESRLINSLDGIGDELSAEKKSKLRQIEADMLRLSDRRQRMNKKDYLNAYLMQLRQIIYTHKHIDYQAALEMMKSVAQLEEIVGDELIQLFKSYMNDLDGEARLISRIESDISKAENTRNRQAKRALDNLSTEEKEGQKRNDNNNFEQMVESLKTFVPSSILNEAMEGIKETETGFVLLNGKEIENNFKQFQQTMTERQQMTKSGRIIDEQLIKQELLYIQQFIKVTSTDELNESTTSPIELVKLKIAEILFNHKLQSVSKTVELEKMLKLLVDLKGILFLYLNDYPTDNIESKQLENIYAKTKSEAERIIEKSHMSREASDASIESHLKLANRLSELENGENDRLDLHMVTVDAAQHVVKVQHEKEAMVAKEQKQTTIYQNRLQNQIDHESYTIKRLVSLLGIDFTTLETAIKQLVEMDQIIMEDLLENLVDGRSRSRMSGKEKQRFLEYCNKYKERREAVEVYILTGQTTSSLEKRVKFQIPSNDTRPSSRSARTHSTHFETVPLKKTSQSLGLSRQGTDFERSNIYRASPQPNLQTDDDELVEKVQRRGLRGLRY